MLSTLVQDVRYAVRWLRRSPTFTAVAALSLAIGIGANTAIFSLASALLLRPLPGLADAGTLVDIGRTTKGKGFDTVGYPYFTALRERATTLAGIYAYRVEPQPMSLAGTHETERVYGTLVSGNYFNVLGTKPVVGRLLQDDDDRLHDDGHAVAVISYDLWQKRFSADPAIVGQTITLNGNTFGVVGVAPKGFQGTTLLKSDLWVPLTRLAQAAPDMPDSLLTNRANVWLVMGGRLKSDVTRAQAQEELNVIATNLRTEYPKEYEGRGLAIARSTLVPGQASLVGGFLALLMAIVGLVLLIACTNVAGMLLARSASRRREIAVRLAVGAGRGRLVRQLLTESVVLFAAGGAAGILISRWLTALLMTVIPQLPVPVAFDIVTDWRVVTFAIGVSLVAALLSGLAPALQASRADLLPSLRTEGLGTGLARLRLRNVFVVGQVAMSILLVIAAGLFLRALQHATTMTPGFNEARVDVVRLDLALAGYKEATAGPFVTTLLERVRALPDVTAATATVDLPLDGGRMELGGLTLPGTDKAIDATWNAARPGFFETLEMPLLRGRDFTAADTPTAPLVAIVNETMAQATWPGQEAIGQTLMMNTYPGSPKKPITIVGVAPDAHFVSIGGPIESYVVVPLSQDLHVRDIAAREASRARQCDSRRPGTSPRAPAEPPDQRGAATE